MFGTGNIARWLLAVVVAGVALLLLRHRFRPDARARRRRERSHQRVVSKAKRPMVKLAVKKPKE